MDDLNTHSVIVMVFISSTFIIIVGCWSLVVSVRMFVQNKIMVKKYTRRRRHETRVGEGRINKNKK